MGEYQAILLSHKTNNAHTITEPETVREKRVPDEVIKVKASENIEFRSVPLTPNWVWGSLFVLEESQLLIDISHCKNLRDKCLCGRIADCPWRRNVEFERGAWLRGFGQSTCRERRRLVDA